MEGLIELQVILRAKIDENIVKSWQLKMVRCRSVRIPKHYIREEESSNVPNNKPE